MFLERTRKSKASAHAYLQQYCLCIQDNRPPFYVLYLLFYLPTPCILSLCRPQPPKSTKLAVRRPAKSRAAPDPLLGSPSHDVRNL